MDQSAIIGLDFSLLVPALTSGLRDSVNPCNFATILIFITILSYLAHTPLLIFCFGGLFVLVSGAVQLLSVMGFWDQLLTVAIYLDVLRVGFLLLAAAFLFIGIVHILDWWRYRQENDTSCFKLQLPVFLRIEKKDTQLTLGKNILLIFQNVGIVICAAIIMSVIGSVYPQSEYLYIVHSYLASGGDRGFVFQSFGLYGIAMITPLIIFWVIIFILALWAKRGGKIISLYKGVLSAVFLSTGIGLGYFFLN